MQIITIQSNGFEFYFKRGFTGKLPRTTQRHEASIYQKRSSAERKVRALRKNHPNKVFRVEDY